MWMAGLFGPYGKEPTVASSNVVGLFCYITDNHPLLPNNRNSDPPSTLPWQKALLTCKLSAMLFPLSVFGLVCFSFSGTGGHLLFRSSDSESGKDHPSQRHRDFSICSFDAQLSTHELCSST